MVQVNFEGTNQVQDSPTSSLGGQDTPWNEKWKEMLAHLLKMHDLFAQLQYITNGILPAMQSFNEGQMGGEADIMNKLSRLLKDENDIQAAFNSIKDYAHMTPQQIFDVTHKAIVAANDILKMVGSDPAFKNNKDLLSSMETQLGQIFGVDLSKGGPLPGDPNDPHYIAFYSGQWARAWDGTAPGSGSSNAAITAYNQSFTAISTEFNSQSSIAQSMFKDFEAKEQQYLGIEQSMASNIIKGEEAANNGIAK